MTEESGHTHSENKKDPDILPDQDVLFHDFAEFCIKHGTHVEREILDIFEQFRLENIPPLHEAGIESITYIPPILDEGTEAGNSMFVIFTDPDIIKTLQLYGGIDGKVELTAIDIDTRLQSEPEPGAAVEAEPMGLEDERMVRMLESLATGIPDPDPEIRRMEERMRTRFMPFDMVPTEELTMLQDAHRRYKQWIDSRPSS